MFIIRVSFFVVYLFEIFVFVYTANIGRFENMHGIKKWQMIAYFLENLKLPYFK